MLALIPLFGVAVTVTGTGDCPAPQTVQAALAALASRTGEIMHSVVIAIDGTRMTVTVRGENEATLSTKTFTEPYSCGERAQVAAVYATTWDVASGLQSPLADVQAPPRPAAAPPQQQPAVAVATAQAVPLQPPPARVLRAGLGVTGVSGAAFQTDSLGLGLSIEGTWRPRPSWGLKAEALGLPERTFAVQTGQAALSRWGAGVAYVRRWPTSIGAVAAEAGALLVKTSVRGQGFVNAGESTAWVPGGRMGLGFDVPLGLPHWHAAFDLNVVVWARSERVAVQRFGAASLGLPQADLLLRLLVAWESQR